MGWLRPSPHWWRSIVPFRGPKPKSRLNFVFQRRVSVQEVDVLNQVAALGEAQAAEGAGERPLPRVDAQVAAQAGLGGGAEGAVLAAEGPVAAVHDLPVAVQAARRGERLLAVAAGVGPLARVHPRVCLQVRSGDALQLADRATDPSFDELFDPCFRIPGGARGRLWFWFYVRLGGPWFFLEVFSFSFFCLHRNTRGGGGGGRGPGDVVCSLTADADLLLLLLDVCVRAGGLLPAPGRGLEDLCRNHRNTEKTFRMMVMMMDVK